MNITPRPHLLEALRSQSLGWTRALGELIDNAIDARATHIAITAEARRLSITDDGIGCPDMVAMLTLGDHRPHGAGRGLGRFGIGLKDAALWLWGTTTIHSVHGSKRYQATVKWEALKRGASWDIEEPTVHAAPHELSGTSIVFSNIEKRLPTTKDLEALLADVAFLFAPAIRRGVRIVIRREQAQPMECPAFAAPPLEPVIDGLIEVAGRSAHVHVGVVPEGIENPRSGLHYTHRHRVIIPASGLGCGDTSTSRIFGWVSLTEQWALSKNKDDVTELKEELGRAVQQFIQPVLDRAAQQAESLELTELEADLTAMLRQGILGRRTEKERRDPGSEKGGVEPKNTGRARGAVKRQPGGRLPSTLNAGKLQVEFVDLLEKEGIGQVDGHASRVKLARNHPYVQRLRLGGNRPALFQMALGLLLHHCVVEPEDGQRMIPGLAGIEQDHQFSVMLARFMAEIEA